MTVTMSLNEKRLFFHVIKGVLLKITQSRDSRGGKCESA